MKTCETCAWFVKEGPVLKPSLTMCIGQMTEFQCRRYPYLVTVPSVDYFCGEHKPKEEAREDDHE